MIYLWKLERPEFDYDEAYEMVVAAATEKDARALADEVREAPVGAWCSEHTKVEKIGVAARGVRGVVVKAVRHG